MQVKGFYIFKKPAPTAFLYFQQYYLWPFPTWTKKYFKLDLFYTIYNLSVLKKTDYCLCFY